jgi:hypothetical protein
MEKKEWEKPQPSASETEEPELSDNAVQVADKNSKRGRGRPRGGSAASSSNKEAASASNAGGGAKGNSKKGSANSNRSSLISDIMMVRNPNSKYYSDGSECK